LNSIIYARTGYQTIEDWLYEEMEDCEDTEEDIEEA
jgi:hypothetical protein